MLYKRELFFFFFKSMRFLVYQEFEFFSDFFFASTSFFF
jgi:hypothetical protein